MSRIQVWNMAGEEVKKMNIKNEVFGIEPNTAVMHAAVVNYLANQRQGTQSTLTRTAVSYTHLVVYGRGHAVVTDTGMNTEMGKIADALAKAEDGQTPLQLKLNQLSKVLSFLVIGI